MMVDKGRTSITGLTCENTTLSTIHSPYYSYYSSFKPEEKVSKR